jgi:ATP-dependent exoDNAse (exonuclease V) beta subunit
MIAAGAAPQRTLTEEFVVVQGAADLVAVLDRELWLVDFKTDHISPQMLPARTKEYAVQLRVYAIALQKVYRRKVTRACLYFLALGRTEWIDLTSLS